MVLRWSYGGGAVSYERDTPEGVVSVGEDLATCAVCHGAPQLVFKAHRLLYDSPLGSRVIEKEEAEATRSLTNVTADTTLQTEISLLTTYWSEST